MGKICDPSPFTGGQSLGVRYRFRFTRTIIRSPRGDVGTVYEEDRVDIDNTVFGIVTGIEIGVFNNYSNFRVFHANGVKLANHGSGLNYYDYYGITEYSYTNIVFTRSDNLTDTGGNPNQTNCRCSDDSCRVECIGQPDGFCCINHSVTNQLLSVLAN